MSPGLMAAQDVGHAALRRIAQQARDGRQRFDQARLIVGAERVEQAADLGARAGVDRGERRLALLREGEDGLAAIVLRRLPHHVAALLEALEHPAEIARIEVELAGELACRRGLVMRQLVDDAALGQRERAVQQALAQHADPARVEAREAAHRLDPLQLLGLRHGDGPA